MPRLIFFLLSWVPLKTGCLSIEKHSAPLGIPRMPSGTYTLVHNNLARNYILHLPQGREYEDKLPLVVALHGAPGTAKNLEETTLLSQKADAAGFIVVYPDGTNIGDAVNKDWNTWNCCTYLGGKGTHDIAFIRTLVGILAREYRIDHERIYAAGFSRGGMLSQMLACEASDLFTGIADIAGAMNFDVCKPKHPVDVLLIHGRQDRNVKFGGAVASKLEPLVQGEDRPVAHAMKIWRRNNHCHSGNTVLRGNIERTHYHCARGEIRLIAIDNEAHTWPGSLPGLSYDKPTQQLSATDEMWDFWSKAHERKKMMGVPKEIVGQPKPDSRQLKGKSDK